MLLPSASKLALAIACQYAWTSGVRWPKRETSPHADFGTAVHAAGERRVNGEPVDLDAIAAEFGVTDVRRFRAVAGNLLAWIDETRADTRGAAEVAFAYHVADGTARVMTKAHARDYSDARPGELFGTADLILRDGDRLVVVDFKTGAKAKEKGAADTFQMRFLGLAAARCYEAAEVDIVLLHVDEGGAYPDGATLTAWDLDDTADELRSLAASLAAPSVPRPGPHCTGMYCPIVSECPATKAAMAAVDKAAALRFPMSVEIASAEHAADVRVRLKMVREACDAIDGAVKDWIRANGPVPVGDGRFYGIVQCDGRESVDLGAPEALAVFRREMGDKAEAALDVSTSKAAIERAVGRKDARAVLAALRDVGAVRKGAPYVKFEEFEKKDEGDAA